MLGSFKVALQEIGADKYAFFGDGGLDGGLEDALDGALEVGVCLLSAQSQLSQGFCLLLSCLGFQYEAGASLLGQRLVKTVHSLQYAPLAGTDAKGDARFATCTNWQASTLPVVWSHLLCGTRFCRTQTRHQRLLRLS